MASVSHVHKRDFSGNFRVGRLFTLCQPTFHTMSADYFACELFEVARFRSRPTFLPSIDMSICRPNSGPTSHTSVVLAEIHCYCIRFGLIPSCCAYESIRISCLSQRQTITKHYQAGTIYTIYLPYIGRKRTPLNFIIIIFFSLRTNERIFSIDEFGCWLNVKKHSF